jgi:hypothetical protein
MICSPHPLVQVIKSRRMRWAGNVVCMGEGKGYRVFVGKPEGKRPLGRPRCSWDDNIKVDHQAVGVWIGFSFLRVETGGGHS